MIRKPLILSTPWGAALPPIRSRPCSRRVRKRSIRPVTVTPGTKATPCSSTVPSESIR